MNLGIPLGLAVAALVAGCQSASSARGSHATPALAPRSTDTVRFSERHPAYWPTDGWKEGAPEEQGLSSRTLAAAVATATARGLPIHSLLVIRHGVVVLDASFYPFTGGRHDIASVTKSITSMLVGAAIRQGSMPSRETRLFDLVPARPARQDARKLSITLADLLAMQSGLGCGIEGSERELRHMKGSAHWIQSAIDMPMRETPGRTFAYCSPNYHLAAAAISAHTHGSVLDFARHALFEPLGISDVEWPADPQGLNHGWGDLQLRPRDLAKLGYLMLHGGKWNGRQLLPRAWIEWSTRRHSKYDDHFYGFGWWSHLSSPPGFYEAIGRGGQRLSIWPKKDIIVVINGGGFRPDDIAPLLVKSIQADTAIEPDDEGQRMLRQAIVDARKAPARVASTLPVCASAVSGRIYRVSQNSMNLRSVSLTFPSADSAVARLDVDKYDLTLPVGMDGLYRTSTSTIDGIAPLTRATWKSPCELVLDFNLVGKIDRYTLALAFDAKDPGAAVVSLTEATGLLKERATASAARR